MGQEQLCRKAPRSLQVRRTILGEGVEKRWEVSLPQRNSQTPAVRSSWLCLVDLHGQAPFSKHLSVPPQTVLVALASSFPESFPMQATGDRPSLPSPRPPTEVCPKDHRGGCTEKLKEKLSPPSAPSRGSPKSCPEPHTRSAAGQVLVLGIHLRKARAPCKNPALERIKP